MAVSKEAEFCHEQEVYHTSQKRYQFTIFPTTKIEEALRKHQKHLLF